MSDAGPSAAMRLRAVAVPAMGAEDVLVATTGPDEGAVFTGHRGRQHLADPPRRTPRRPGRATPAAGRSASRSCADGRLLVVRRHPRPAPRRPTIRRGRDAARPRSTAAGCWSLQQRRRRRERDIWFSDSRTVYPIERVEGRLRRAHPDRPAAPARPRRHGRGPPRRAGLRQRRRAWPRTSRSSRGRDRRRTVVRLWLTGPRAGQPRPARRRPARLPRQHRPRQRRPDLGDDRQPRGPGRRAAAQRAPLLVRKRGRPGSPRRCSPKPKRTVRVQAYDDDGRAGARHRRRRARVPHGHRRTGARRAGLARQPARARPGGCRSGDRSPRLDHCADSRRCHLTAPNGGVHRWVTSSTSRVRRTCAGSTTDQLDELASEIRDELIRTCSRSGGHLGPNLGVVELTMAIHRVFDSPRDRVVFDTGHQAYVHKMLTGRAADVRHAAPRGRPLRLPEPGRVRPRHRGELPRLHLAVLRRRPGQGLRDPRRGPARRRGHRRRRADRRHGLGGAEQHRDAKDQQAGRWSSTTTAAPTCRPSAGSPPPDHAAHQPALRADPRRGQAPPQRRARRRPGGVRRPARDEEGHEGRPRPAGALRGPRPEVRRPDRRPRPRGRGAGTHPGQALRRPGDRARDDPQGLRLRPGGAARGRPVPPDRARSTWRPARRRPRAGSGPTIFSEEMVGARRASARTSSRSPRRCSTRSGWTGSPRRTPTGPSTSASPSSTPSPARPASRWAACTRSSRSTPPSSTAPSTRC